MHYEDALYGAVELPAAVADLLHTAPIQRLRGIHQGGAIVPRTTPPRPGGRPH